MAKYLTDAIIPSLKAKVNGTKPRLTITTLINTSVGKPYSNFTASSNMSNYDLIQIIVSGSPFNRVSMVTPPPTSGVTYGETYHFSADVLEEGMIGDTGPHMRFMDVTIRLNPTTINLQRAYYGMITSMGSGESTATGQVKFNIYEFANLKILVNGIKIG